MSNFTNFSIVASFLGLWINSFFNETTQIIIGFVLIFTFGILHGANDLLLIQKSNPTKSKLKFTTILLYYVLVVIFGALLFFFLPMLALILFILISSYHFGEQHWYEKFKTENHPIKKIFYMMYGFLILSMLFYFHAEEVQLIIKDITNFSIPIQWIEKNFYVASFLFITLLLVMIFKSRSILSDIFRELFLLFVFAIIFKTSSLIWGFALYFILWHSIPSLKDQISFLYGNFTFKFFKKYIKSAFIYWFVSLIGIFGLYFVLKNEQVFDALFFSFLAAITFPHVFVIISMLETKE
jgi:Brp/Blh family beta-carotene 15,15'-monooxygenase